MKNKNALKIGDLVYLKDVGFPFNGGGTDGYDSMEGASATVIAINSGYYRDMIKVEFLFPFKSKSRNETMDTCHFYPVSVHKENRPWLEKNIKRIVAAKSELRKTQERIVEILQEM